MSKQSQRDIVADLIAHDCPPDHAPPSFIADAIVLLASGTGPIREADIDRLVSGHRMGAGAHPLSEVRFLTVIEVARALQVSKMSVYRLVHSGELPAVRVGRSFRIPEQAVTDYLHRYQQAAN